MTAKYDRTSVWIIVGAVLLPVLLAVIAGFIFAGGNVLFWILAVVLGIMAGVLLGMYALNWRAEKVAFGQLEGKPGAAGAVLSSTLRGQWQTSDMPVAFNAKTQDAVYRAIGKPGIVLVSEGTTSASRKLVEDERRKMQRIVPNVPVHHVHAGNGEGQVPLLGLRKALRKLDGKLTKPEILAVSNRLRSMPTSQLPIPKGIDPNKMRPSRAHLR